MNVRFHTAAKLVLFFLINTTEFTAKMMPSTLFFRRKCGTLIVFFVTLRQSYQYQTYEKTSFPPHFGGNGGACACCPNRHAGRFGRRICVHHCQGKSDNKRQKSAPFEHLLEFFVDGFFRIRTPAYGQGRI